MNSLKWYTNYAQINRKLSLKSHVPILPWQPLLLLPQVLQRADAARASGGAYGQASHVAVEEVAVVAPAPTPAVMSVLVLVVMVQLILMLQRRGAPGKRK